MAWLRWIGTSKGGRDNDRRHCIFGWGGMTAALRTFQNARLAQRQVLNADKDQVDLVAGVGRAFHQRQFAVAGKGNVEREAVTGEPAGALALRRQPGLPESG